tara:strand:- start:328 stop:924 length:597 start_codon:yes stop_codon:yes gene_type:complete
MHAPDNPLAQLRLDRDRARELDDPYAGLCVLALATPDGQPSVRTLVLRDVDDESLTLFVNRSSPKWAAVEAGARCELLVYYASVDVQYRIAGPLTPLDREIIEANWQRRPTPAKYLDYVYEHRASQSSPIDDREALLAHFSELGAEHPEDTLQAPAGAAGLTLRAERVDRLNLATRNRVHDRRLYVLQDGWQARTLVP